MIQSQSRMAILDAAKKKGKAKAVFRSSNPSKSKANETLPSNSTTISLPLGEQEDPSEPPPVPPIPQRFSPQLQYQAETAPQVQPPFIAPQGSSAPLPIRPATTPRPNWLDFQGLAYGVGNGHGHDPWASYLPPPPNSYIHDPPDTGRQRAASLPTGAYGTLQAASRSALNLTSDVWHQASAQAMNSTAALLDVISSKLDRVITCIDGEAIINEQDLLMYQHQDTNSSSEESTRSIDRSGASSSPKPNHFAKVWLYGNARLPPHLPPIKFYLPTYPLLCLAAQYSLRVYDKPAASEREDHVSASVLKGTKAMVLKSLPLDDMNTIVFAIRGTSSFMDWAINFRLAPTSPKGVLDDEGNLTHVGFLGVAKSMIAPVAARLTTLLQENPSRRTASLLITGHSAGGAVAQLLYMHMISETVSSELTYLTSFFKRVHCVTFGAPPVTLLPLRKPDHKKLKKSLFLAFANEGDPVLRADTAVLRSILKLLAAPAPNNALPGPSAKPVKKYHKAHKSTSTLSLVAAPTMAPIWKVPQTALSLGGRLVLLREKVGSSGKDDVEACQVHDDMFRGAVFGDPMCHSMTLYAKRVEILATNAVTGRG